MRCSQGTPSWPPKCASTALSYYTACATACIKAPRCVCLQAMWLYILPVDALEVVRTSALKVAKAAQAVAKFFLQVHPTRCMCMHVCVCVCALGCAGLGWLAFVADMPTYS